MPHRRRKWHRNPTFKLLPSPHPAVKGGVLVIHIFLLIKRSSALGSFMHKKHLTGLH